MSESTEVAELRALVQQLFGRVEELERDLAQLREIPHDDLVAISAAVAAYLGKRAKVKRVRVRRGTGWAAQARSDIHRSHAAFGSR